MPATGWNVDVPAAEFYGPVPCAKWEGYLPTRDLNALIREIEACPEVAIDTETTGLVVWRDYPIYFSIAWGNRRATLPACMLPCFAKAFADPRKTWILANAKYDMHILANAGHILRGHIIDICVEHALLFEDMPHGLKPVAHQMLGWKWRDFQDTFGKINDNFTPADLIRKAEWENFPLLVEYAANDAWGTLCCHRELKKLLQDAATHSLFRDKPPYIHTLWDLFEKIEMPYTRVLWKNERNGILIDLESLHTSKPIAEAEIRQLEAQMAQTVGRVFNPNSTHQLRTLFIDNYGVTPLKMSKGGKTGVRQASVDSKFLEHYADLEITGHEANVDGLRKARDMAGLLVKHRKVTKLYGTYIVGLSGLVDRGGRIHTKFNQDVARTGRLSSAEPNLQNIPNAEKDTWKLRKGFIARPGHKLVVADYCVHPSTRILTRDMKWVAAETLRKGDQLVGFDEQLGRANYRHSHVQATKRLTKPCLKVTMSDGTELICSTDHQWVVGGGGHTWKRRHRSWVRADELEVGDQIAHAVKPWEYDASRDAGYLSGILDGEGWVAKTGKVGFAQRPNQCLAECERILAGMDLEFSRRSRAVDDVQAVEFYKAWGGLRALGMLRPPRLMEKTDSLWVGKRTWSSYTKRHFVTKIESVGNQEVIALQTTSKTFIAEGFLSHNCQLEMRLLACAAMEPSMIDIFLQGRDIHMGNANIVFGIPYDDMVAAKAMDKAVKHGDVPESSMTEYFHMCMQKRRAVKSVGFGLNYGMGPQKMASDIGVPQSEAESIIEQYLNTYPAVAQFYADAIAETERTGYAFTLLGRRRNIPEIMSNRRDERSKGERQAVNTQIQGTAADVVKMAQIRLDSCKLDEIYDCHALLNVHDELIHELPESDTECKGIIKDWMEHPFVEDLAVPLTVDIEEGHNWQDCH